MLTFPTYHLHVPGVCTAELPWIHPAQPYANHLLVTVFLSRIKCRHIPAQLGEWLTRADMRYCRYAWECQTQEGGWGLDGVLREHSWKLRGIVNGMDYSEWSPGADPHLRSDGYANYGTDDLVAGKARCKEALQRVRAPSEPHMGHLASTECTFLM